MNNKQNQFESGKTLNHNMANIEKGSSDSNVIVKEAREKGVGNHRLKALDTLLNNK
ncbi:hypothetical protein [Priestia megaterium]|uniref:hypothetical protein n=1 Tax=Priestia megaterium TaxID=1404 RepID=UPI0014946F3E|nr:hypothetical protein [Priestia megaterium]